MRWNKKTCFTGLEIGEHDNIAIFHKEYLVYNYTYVLIILTIL